MNRFWVIGDSKKALFWKKPVFFIFYKLFLHTFPKNGLFATRPPFLNGRAVTRYISYGKRQKSCTLIVI